MIDPKSKSIRSSINSAFNRKKSDLADRKNYSEIEKKEEIQENIKTKEKRLFDAEITQS
jgi:hypothetical protein